jgi:NTP pyrophosphatase (non-canonical NTP hydrolase)
MKRDDAAIVQRLFALATGVASEAAEVAVAGQNSRNSVETATSLATRLEDFAADLLSLANAIHVCARTIRHETQPN